MNYRELQVNPDNSLAKCVNYEAPYGTILLLNFYYFLINILGYDKYMKGYDNLWLWQTDIGDYDRYMKGYYKYITGYDKYTTDFLKKILMAMMNIFTSTPKKIFTAVVSTVSMVSGVN